MPRQIVRVDAGNGVFLRSLGKVKDAQRRREIVETLRELFLLDLDAAPARLHLHQLTGKSGCSVIDSHVKVPIWTIHVTADDTYKASFTFEDGCAYLRVIRTHDRLDDDP